MWPHELFAALWKHHPAAFKEFILGGNADCIRQFWETMPPRSGMLTKPHWRERCIPLSLHGDGVAVASARGKGVKTVDCLNWGSLLASGPTRLTSYLIWFCFNHTAKKSGFAATWPGFWKQLCWSLTILWRGRWPSRTLSGDPHPLAGQPLAGGFFAVIYIKKGDLPWISSQLGVAHSSSQKPCALCQCTNYGDGQDIMPWTDCNNPPSWLPSCWTDEDLIVKAQPLSWGT